MENPSFGNLMSFDLPKDKESIIKVVGVGGGGSNAVNHMYNLGIRDVDFVVCNTDEQALLASPIPTKIQLGADLTEGRGAGSIPEVGKNAAIENLDDVRTVFSKGTKMVFITAGLGGGTGTGAAPVIAQLAREMGILTVGIVTMPFSFEGRKRKEQAEKGLNDLRKNVDTLLIISNEKLREIHGNLTMSAAFAKADDVLAVAAKSIAEIITVPGHVNVDFADVTTVMIDGGNAIMGSAVTSGESRAIRAVETAMASPLLNDNCIVGARHVLLHISYGTHELGMDEMSEITDFVQDEAGQTAEIILGTGFDASLGENLCVTVIATGFTSKENSDLLLENKISNVVLELDTTQPLFQPEVAPNNLNNTEVIFGERIQEAQSDNKPVLDTLNNNVEYLSLTAEDLNLTDTSSSIPTLDLFKADADSMDIFSPLAENITKEDELFIPITDKVPLASFDNKPSEEPEKTKEDLYRQNERMLRLKEISHRLKSPSGLKDLESEPAYMRRNIKLEENTDNHAISGSSVSFEDGEVKIVKENRFLHGNVD